MNRIMAEHTLTYLDRSLIKLLIIDPKNNKIFSLDKEDALTEFLDEYIGIFFALHLIEAERQSINDNSLTVKLSCLDSIARAIISTPKLWPILNISNEDISAFSSVRQQIDGWTNGKGSARDILESALGVCALSRIHSIRWDEPLWRWE